MVIRDAATSRRSVEDDVEIEIDSNVRERLRRHGETIEDYARFLRHTRETDRERMKLSSWRLYEAMRRARFDPERYVGDHLATRLRLDAESRSLVERTLVPLCRDLIESRTTAIERRGIAKVGNVGFRRMIEIDASEREAWDELEARFAEQIDEMSKELRSHVDPGFDEDWR